MRLPDFPFGARFLIFLGAVGGAMIAAAIVLAMVGLLGVRLTVFTPPLALAFTVGAGLVIGGLIVAAFSNAVWLAATRIVVALLLLAVALIGLFAAGVIPLGVLLIVIAVIGHVALFLFALWFNFGAHPLPLQLVGLGDLTSMPSVPFRPVELIDTIVRLFGRGQEIEPAKQALLSRFTLGRGAPTEQTATGYEFMFADEETRQLDDPHQFAMGWTTIDGTDQRAAPLARPWNDSLTDPTEATRQFWRTIAQFSTAFNIVPLERLAEPRADVFRTLLGPDWTPFMARTLAERRLFVIDMRIFEGVDPPTTANPRFTPATVTFLEFIEADKRFRPFKVGVSNGERAVIYDSEDEGHPCQAWIYALQAAKASITVWGIWLGHVYRYHMVTAPMLMTSEQTMAMSHPIRQMIAHQADFVIGFDQFLLIDWAIAPPTSIADSDAFLKLTDAYAAGRPFFADDPLNVLAAQGLTADMFTSAAPFDLYPVARYLLDIFANVRSYAAEIVAAVYPDDAAVAGDAALQAWFAASRRSDGGNVTSLPAVTTKAILTDVLTSLIFRITAHGIARTAPSANPALTWVSNFPPCLEDSRLPDPATPMTMVELLAFMPKTKTMGQMINFLMTFGYSPPYIPFIPIAGVDADLPFSGAEGAACNAAVVAFRRRLRIFMTFYFADSNVQTAPARMDFQVTRAQAEQWELNIEL